MRRYYGAGYHGARPSLFNVIAILAACVAVALSVYVAIGRKPVQGPPVGQKIPTTPPIVVNEPAPGPSPTVTVTIPGPPAAEPVSGTKPVPPVTPRPRCRNSTNPACGRFFWSPAPAKDAALRVDVSYFPADPAPGEEVTFTVTAKDGDARIREIFKRFGEKTDKGPTHTDCVTPARYGPWTPPSRQAGTRTMTFTHVYEKAGTYSAQFTVESGDCGSPYADAATLPVKLVVEAAVG